MIEERQKTWIVRFDECTNLWVFEYLRAMRLGGSLTHLRQAGSLEKELLSLSIDSFLVLNKKIYNVWR